MGLELGVGWGGSCEGALGFAERCRAVSGRAPGACVVLVGDGTWKMDRTKRRHRNRRSGWDMKIRGGVGGGVWRARGERETLEQSTGAS